jgi:hypothetical protein
LNKIGIECTAEEIYCSAFAASTYLASIDFKKKVYVIGDTGIG